MLCRLVANTYKLCPVWCRSGVYIQCCMRAFHTQSRMKGMEGERGGGGVRDFGLSSTCDCLVMAMQGVMPFSECGQVQLQELIMHWPSLHNGKSCLCIGGIFLLKFVLS